MRKIEPANGEAWVRSDAIPQRPLRHFLLPGRVLTVGQRKKPERRSPTSNRRLIGDSRRAYLPNLLEITCTTQPDGFSRRRRKLIRLKRHDGPPLGLGPGAFEVAKGGDPTLGGTRAQDEPLLDKVITHHNGEMPLRPPIERQVLQNQNWIAGRHFRQHVLQARAQRIDQKPRRPRCGDHFHLKAAPSLRDVHLIHEHIRISRNTPLRQHGSKRSRPALIGFLRVERHFGQLSRRRKVCIVEGNSRRCTASDQSGQQ